MDRFHKAFEMAVKAHKGQIRKLTGSPVIVHPLAVMGILRNYDIKDEDILIAAVLHDVVEDSPTELKEIKKEFGERVADLVDQVSKKPDKTYPIRDEGGVVLKMADLIHNGLCMPKDNEKKINNYIKRTDLMIKNYSALMEKYPKILDHLKKVLKKVKTLK